MLAWRASAVLAQQLVKPSREWTRRSVVLSKVPTRLLAPQQSRSAPSNVYPEELHCQNVLHGLGEFMDLLYALKVC